MRPKRPGSLPGGMTGPPFSDRPEAGQAVACPWRDAMPDAGLLRIGRPSVPNRLLGLIDNAVLHQLLVLGIGDIQYRLENVFIVFAEPGSPLHVELDL
jgi:hypothetical protein